MADLIANLRAKHPGAYNDLTDADLAQKVATKFPAYAPDLQSYLSAPDTDPDRQAIAEFGQRQVVAAQRQQSPIPPAPPSGVLPAPLMQATVEGAGMGAVTGGIKGAARVGAEMLAGTKAQQVAEPYIEKLPDVSSMVGPSPLPEGALRFAGEQAAFFAPIVGAHVFTRLRSTPGVKVEEAQAPKSEVNASVDSPPTGGVSAVTFARGVEQARPAEVQAMQKAGWQRQELPDGRVKWSKASPSGKTEVTTSDQTWRPQRSEADWHESARLRAERKAAGAGGRWPGATSPEGAGPPQSPIAPPAAPNAAPAPEAAGGLTAAERQQLAKQGYPPQLIEKIDAEHRASQGQPVVGMTSYRQPQAAAPAQSSPVAPPEAAVPPIVAPAAPPPAPAPEATPPSAALPPEKPVEAAPPAPTVATENRTEALPAGRDVQIFGQQGNRYEAKYRVVGLDDLQLNHPEVQPRQRGRAASKEQIAKIAKNLDAGEYLAGEEFLDRGAAIVGPDLKVESGNGRVSGIKLARQAHPDRYAQFQADQRERALQFGLEPEVFDGIKDPVIVRERTTDVADRKAFAEEANAAAGLGMSPAETAIRDARSIAPEVAAGLHVGETQTIEQALLSTRNAGIIRTFLEGLDANERGSLITGDGKGFTPLGLQRVKAALLARVFPGEAGQRLVTTFTESTDSNIKNAENAIFAALPQLAKVRELAAAGKLPPVDLGEDIAKAVDRLSALRTEGTKVDYYLRQQQLGQRELTPLQENLLSFIDNAKSAKPIREMLQQYAQEALKLPDPGQVSFVSLGAALGVSKEQLLLQAQRPAQGMLGSETGAVVLPHPLVTVAEAMRATGKNLQRLINPAGLASEDSLNTVIGRKGEDIEALRVQYNRMSEGNEALFDRMIGRDGGPAGNRDYLNRMSVGDPQPTPELTKLAEFHRRAFDAAALGVAQVRGVMPYLTDFVPGIWKDRDAAEQFFKARGKRPMEGSKNFLRKKFYLDRAEALAAGLEPVTENAETLVRTYLEDTRKFVWAQHVRADGRKAGRWSWVRDGAKLPEGKAWIDDAIARKYFPSGQFIPAGEVSTDGVKIRPIAGRWAVDEGEARLINNHLSRDYLRADPTLRGVMWANSKLNALQLGLSGFHIQSEAWNAWSTVAGRGLQQLAHGRPLKALGTLARVPTAPLEYLARGARAWNDPLLYEGPLSPLANGMRLAHPTGAFAPGSVWDNFKSAVRRRDWSNALVQSVGVPIDLSTKPIFEYMVPRMKVGAYLDMLGHELERNPTANPRTVARTIADSIDNRMGQVNYDNWFWNNTFKSSMQLAFRAVGWNFGFGREFVGAGKDVAKNVSGLLTGGTTPGFTPKMQWVAGMAFTQAAGAALYQYLHTGKGLESMTDIFAPRNGQLDEHGNEIRVRFANPLKDAYGLTHDPLQTVANKAAPVPVEFMRLMLTNKDYFGDYIRNKNDPALTQLHQVFEHLQSSAFTPFSLQQRSQIAQAPTKESSFESFMGITKAPREMIVNDPLERQMRERVSQLRPERGPRTPEAKALMTEHNQAQRTLQSAMGFQRHPTDRLLRQLPRAEREAFLSKHPELSQRPNTDPITQEMLRLHIALPQAHRVVKTTLPGPDGRPQSMDLTTEQALEVATIRGNLLRQRLGQVLANPTYGALPDAAKASWVKTVMKGATADATKQEQAMIGRAWLANAHATQDGGPAAVGQPALQPTPVP